jgi:hypothetical protein
MNKMIYLRASEKYVKSYCSTLDTVAKERKYLAATTGFPEERSRSFVN